MVSLSKLLPRISVKWAQWNDKFGETEGLLRKFEADMVFDESDMTKEFLVPVEGILEKEEYYWRPKPASKRSGCQNYEVISCFSRKFLGFWPKPLSALTILRLALNFVEFPSRSEKVVAEIFKKLGALPVEEKVSEEECKKKIAKSF